MLDFRLVAAEFDRVVRSRCPEQVALAGRLFDRIGPDRWRLEWSLPVWLGKAVGLHPEIVAGVVRSTVMGLGAIRLEDDLADGEVAPEEIAGARVLLAVLFDAAIQPYRAMFDDRSPFWAELDRRMDEWRAAARDGTATPANLGADGRAGDAGRLAARGAPLHIPACAVCLAADRPELYPALGRSLDHVLEAEVLYDHAADWQADLEAGRWNAFVVAMSSETDARAHRERRRAAVRVGLMTSDRAQAYFDRIGDHLSTAIALAEQLPVPVPPLVEHLRSFVAEIDAQGASYRDRYRELGDRSARLLFPGATHGR